MLVYQTVYIGVVCENLEDIQGNTWGNARSPHRVAMSSRSVAFWASVKRHAFCVQRQRTSNSESSHGNHHIIFQQTVPLCHVFFVVCINPLVHHLKQRPQKTCWRLASWSDPFFFCKSWKTLANNFAKHWIKNYSVDAETFCLNLTNQAFPTSF